MAVCIVAGSHGLSRRYFRSIFFSAHLRASDVLKLLELFPTSIAFAPHSMRRSHLFALHFFVIFVAIVAVVVDGGVLLLPLPGSLVLGTFRVHL